MASTPVAQPAEIPILPPPLVPPHLESGIDPAILESLKLPELAHDDPAQILADSSAFREELQQIRGMGHRVLVEPKVFCNPYGDVAGFYRLLEEHRLAKCPLNAVPPETLARKDIVPELYYSAEPLAFSPFRISSKTREDKKGSDTIIVEVLDYLAPGIPTIFSREYPAKEIAQKQPQILAEIEALLTKFADKHQAQIDAIPQDPERRNKSLYLIDQSAAPNDKEREVRRQLFLKYPALAFLGLRRGDDLESVDTGGAARVMLDRQSLDRLGYPSMLVKGQACSIVLKRDLSRFQAEQEGLSTAPTNVSYRDRFGNFISCTRDFDAAKNQLTETILVNPPLALTPRGAPPAERREISIDFSPIGLGIVSRMFADQPETALDFPGTPTVYCNTDHRTVARDFGSSIPIVQSSVNDISRYLGKPGQAQNIVIMSSERSNGFCPRSNPDTIVLTTAFIRDPNKSCLAAGVTHEVLHLIDAAHDYSLSAGKFAGHFSRLLQADSPFFNQIEERSFLSRHDSTFGRSHRFGHASDSPVEFFASFLNSMQHPQWKSRMNDFSPQFRNNYLETLKVLKQQLTDTGLIPQQAPVMQDISSKIAFLENLRQGKPVTWDDKISADGRTEAPRWTPPNQESTVNTAAPTAPQPPQHRRTRLFPLFLRRRHSED